MRKIFINYQILYRTVYIYYFFAGELEYGYCIPLKYKVFFLHCCIVAIKNTDGASPSLDYETLFRVRVSRKSQGGQKADGE